MKPEGPADQEKPEPQTEAVILINCVSGRRGRVCRYTWADGLIEWFTDAEVHRKGQGRPTRPEEPMPRR